MAYECRYPPHLLVNSNMSSPGGCTAPDVTSCTGRVEYVKDMQIILEAVLTGAVPFLDARPCDFYLRESVKNGAIFVRREKHGFRRRTDSRL